MGSSHWSDDFYNDRQATRAAAHIPTFHHDADVRAGRATAIHEALDPAKLKNGQREARDSVAHPNSKPVGFMLDVTGSMSGVPRIVQTKLPLLMNTIIKNGHLADPQILVGAIGDAYSDQAPLQVGQFESGVEIDDDITRLFLEGNGGGQNKESYELALYFFARKVVSDAWEKRKEKGYLFMTGDEHPYDRATRDRVKRVFGDDIGEDITVEDLVKECEERWNIFFIIPAGTSHASEASLHKHWSDLLGPEHVIKLADASHICETVATAISYFEGATTPAKAASDLKASGVSENVVHAITKALDPLAKSKAIPDAADKKVADRTARL